MTTHDLGLTDKNAGCDCAGHAASTAAPTSPSALTTDYLVSGMSCAHCVASVTEELTALDGVESVGVELNPGGASRVAVASTVPLEREAVRAAIEEAGYTLVAS